MILALLQVKLGVLGAHHTDGGSASHGDESTDDVRDEELLYHDLDFSEGYRHPRDRHGIDATRHCLLKSDWEGLDRRKMFVSGVESNFMQIISRVESEPAFE